jgi:defect-in-organelle-trafficking protein DotC
MVRCKLKARNLFALLAVLLLASGVARAQLAYDNGEAPQDLKTLQEVQKTEPVIGQKAKKNPNDKLEGIVDEEKDLALKIRHDSMRDSARSYGARGGLSWRTKYIMDQLKLSSSAMDKAFNFRRLLIKAPSNMYIEPPIISEALNNFLVLPSGIEAAAADAIYQITNQARIVSTSRDWRQYLERDWKKIAPPPDILLPENERERANWRRWISEGWDEGVHQADEIFQSDLDLLIADFEGMVRYRKLLAEGKISAPYATMVDRGISSTKVQTVIGNRPVNITTQMRVGDRALRITAPSSLREGNQGAEWQTAPQEVQ